MFVGFLFKHFLLDFEHVQTLFPAIKNKVAPKKK
jgi:hypothetical protein